MLKVALRGLAGRKLRAVLTALAIVLGVAMVSGTYVLTDTIKAGFDAVFTSVYKNTDAVVTGRSALGGTTLPPSFSAALLPKVRALPDVAAAAGGISDQAQLVGPDGKVIAVGGAPGLAFSVDPHGSQRFNPLRLVKGRWPETSDQIAIDEATASRKHYAIGDTIGAIARGPVHTYRITGIAKLGGVSSIGGATIAVFDPATAATIFHKQGKLDEIDVAAKSGVPATKLVAEIRTVLPPATQVRTGKAQAQKSGQDVASFTGILQKFLLAFGGIALFVGIFVIANTLSITIAQRAREFGTLRTLGATRRQVLTSVIAEGFVIGTLASVVGLFFGLLLAKGLDGLFKAAGVDLPKAGTVFATRTIVISLVVGIAVTLLASIMPAIRATRVEPIAAVREGVLPPSRLARFGLPVAIVTLAIGLVLVLVGAFDHGLSGTPRLAGVGFGVVIVFIGTALLAPRFVPPLARVLGWPARTFGGAAGGLASDNAARNPARTASTAAALMIGLALVTAVGVLAQGLKTTVTGSIQKQFKLDYAITSENGFTPTGVASEAAVRAVPGVQVVSGVRANGEGRVLGGNVGIAGVAPDVGRVIDLDWKQGGPGVPRALGLTGVFADSDFASAHHLHVGRRLSVLLPSGKHLQLTLLGVYKPPKAVSPLGTLNISQQLFDRTFPEPENVYAFVLIRGGVTPANTARLTRALATYPDAKVQTESQFKKQQESGINLLLNLLYVLLSLSIVVSLFGIVNTLVLTVFERTREIGMLRAVGMTRRQTRRMIRHESIVTALIGAALGIPLGIALAVLIGQAIGFAAFAIPWGTLVVFVVFAILVGIVAAIFPARRAARLNVLEALQYE